MARRCFVHVGLMKTGTSYLQGVLWASGPALAHRGVSLLPPDRHASLAVALDTRDRVGPDEPDSTARALADLRELADAVPGPTALLSMELLAPATPSQVRRLLEHLPGFELHLVVTVRELARVLPSMWQQRLRTGREIGLVNYLDAVIERSPAAGDFWAQQDLAAILAAWSVIPADRVHVVTLPPSGGEPGTLLARFCSVIGVDPASLPTDATPGNESIGLVQAEVLRRVNAHVNLSGRQARGAVMKRYFAKEVLGGQDGTAPRVPVRYREWFATLAAEHAAVLRDGGYDVVGDLADLEPHDSSFVADDPVVGEAEVAAAAALALGRVLEDRWLLGQEMRSLRRRLRRARGRERELTLLAELAAVRAKVSEPAWRRLLRRTRSRRPQRDAAGGIG